MEFAVNYSPALAKLVREGEVQIDRFKCPDWPDLLADAQQAGPLYIHFPLWVGSGAGYPIDTETHQPADLERIAGLMEQSGTPFVNTHLSASVKQQPDIPIESRDPVHIRRVIDSTLRDLEPLIRRFGAERVLVENLINQWGMLTAAVLPETIGRVLEETGCGLLLDLSHARLAARNLGLAERAYVSAMPVEHLQEVHVTGLRLIDEPLLKRMRAADTPGLVSDLQAGQWLDHFPMEEVDWRELEWLAGELRDGRWRKPWVVSFEFGGVGGIWEEMSDRTVYLDQLPRMASLIRG